jgi:hypothetical protein
MVKNRVSAEVDQATLESVLAHIAAINTALPFLISISPEERRAMLKGGDRSQAFIRKAVEVGAKIENHLPRSFSINEMRRDVALSDQLFPVVLSLSQLAEKLSDTHAVASSEAYASALLIYRTGKQVKDDEGLTKAVADLGRRFERSDANPADVDAEMPADADA